MSRCAITVTVNDDVIARFVNLADARIFAQAMRESDMLSASDTPDALFWINDPAMKNESISY